MDSQDHVNRVCKAPKQLRQRKADRRARLPHLKPNLGRHVLRSSSEGQVKKPDSVLVSPTLSHSSLKGGGCEHQSSVGGKTKHVPRTGSHPSEFSSPMQERRREGRDCSSSLGPVSWVRLKERSSVGVPVGTRELALAARVQLRGHSSCTHLRATEPVVSRKTHRSPAGPRGEETAQFTN